VFAQVEIDISEIQLNDSDHLAIIEKTIEIFDEYYPLVDVQEEMKKFITQKYKSSDYDNFQ
jgi:hypothetical protein